MTTTGNNTANQNMQMDVDTLTVSAGGSARSATFQPMGNPSAQLSVNGVGNTNDTNEDTLFTYTLPAQALLSDGQGVLIQAFGSTANNASTHTVKVYFGATSYSISAGQNNKWQVTMEVYKKGSSTQVGFTQADVGSTRQAPTVIKPTETDTGSIMIKVTGQTSVAAANDVVANGLIVTMMN